jgi:hypothetical protein
MTLEEADRLLTLEMMEAFAAGDESMVPTRYMNLEWAHREAHIRVNRYYRWMAMLRKLHPPPRRSYRMTAKRRRKAS